MLTRLFALKYHLLRLPLILLLVLATACAIDPEDYDPCPPISTLEEAAWWRTIGNRIGQVVEIRFNGVYGQCIQRRDHSDMNLVVNLYMKRDAEENPSAEGVVAVVTIAVVDADNQVVERRVVTRNFFIPAFSSRSRPVFAVNVNVPQDHRVIVGLGQASEAS